MLGHDKSMQYWFYFNQHKEMCWRDITHSGRRQVRGGRRQAQPQVSLICSPTFSVSLLKCGQQEWIPCHPPPTRGLCLNPITAPLKKKLCKHLQPIFLRLAFHYLLYFYNMGQYAILNVLILLNGIKYMVPVRINIFFFFRIKQISLKHDIITIKWFILYNKVTILRKG